MTGMVRREALHYSHVTGVVRDRLETFKKYPGSQPCPYPRDSDLLVWGKACIGGYRG